jgi:sarcosine oxidase subunit gamma
MTSTTKTPTRLSPVHDQLGHLHPRWGALDGMPVALTFGGRTVEQEDTLAQTLALGDFSVLHRAVIKGPGAASFLEVRGVAPALPAEVLRVLPLTSGGLIARTGLTEYFLEDAPAEGGRPNVVAPVTESLLSSPQPGVYPALRQDASFLLSGDRAPAVLLQTCGFDFRQPGFSPSASPDQATVMVMTRVAGVSTWVVHRAINGKAVYQLWADGTYGPYLWETLLKISREFDGDAVGLSVFFPELEAGLAGSPVRSP